MIAPLRHTPAPAEARQSELVRARRALASVLFVDAEDQSRPRVSNRKAWAFAVWTMLLAASYFAMASWWSVEPDEPRGISPQVAARPRQSLAK